jgi:tetratricopeptide (TPR) repeat protein
MKSMFNKLLVVLFLFILSNQAFANKFLVVPPDSSSSIIDRTAALFLIDEGKKFFNLGKSIDAVRKFREAYVRDKYSANAAYWIGKAHYSMDNYGYALKYAKIAESLSEADDGEVFLLLGEAYHRQSYLDSARMNYDLAKIQLNTAKRNAFNIDQKIEEVSFAQSVQDKPIKYEKTLLDNHINSGYDDYNPVITNKGKTMYFSSRRPDTKGGKINPDDQRYFEDVYKSDWSDSLNNWSDATNAVERLNSEGFDAIGDITNENEAYLTVNTSIIDTKNTTRSSDICTSSLTKEDRWNTPKPIKNKTIYSVNILWF